MSTSYTASGFFCDLVITDSDEKHSLIGIYPETLRVPSFPLPLPFGLFVKIAPAPPSGSRIVLRLEQPGETVFMDDVIEVPARRSGTTEPAAMHLALKQILVMLQEPCNLDLVVKIGELDPIVAASLSIASDQSP